MYFFVVNYIIYKRKLKIHNKVNLNSTGFEFRVTETFCIFHNKSGDRLYCMRNRHRCDGSIPRVYTLRKTYVRRMLRIIEK